MPPETVLDALIYDKCRFFGLDERFIKAMVKAEGGSDAFVRAVQCSIPTCKSLEKAIEIACRSVSHRAFEYAIMATEDPEQFDKYDNFVHYLGSKWAPLGVSNDPTNLNKNWVKNVEYWYGRYQTGVVNV